MDVAGLHHVAINVTDLAAARAFYVDGLGFTEVDRPDFGFPGAWIQAGPNQIHLMEWADATRDRRQHFALQVADLDAAVTELEGRGVRVDRSPYVPGAGRQAFLLDPSGNSIELNEPGP